MGISLYTITAPPESGREELVRRFRAHFRMLGVAEDRSNVCDREILIGPVQSGSWLAIYDSGLESPDERLMDELSSLASADGFGPAVGVLVYDSDLLEMKFYRDSVVCGRFSSWPGYFRGDRKPSYPKLDNEAAWHTLTSDVSSPTQLASAWRSSESESAEELLARVARALGWEDGAAQVWPASLLFREGPACAFVFRQPLPPAPLRRSYPPLPTCGRADLCAGDDGCTTAADRE